METYQKTQNYLVTMDVTENPDNIWNDKYDVEINGNHVFLHNKEKKELPEITEDNLVDMAAIILSIPSYIRNDIR